MTRSALFYQRIENFLSSRPFKIGIIVISVVTLAWCFGYYFFFLRPSQAQLKAYIESEGREKVYLVPERNIPLSSTSVPDIAVLPEVKEDIKIEGVGESASEASPKWEWHTTETVSDSTDLMVDELDTHNQPLDHSNSDTIDNEIPHNSDALLDEAYDSLFVAKETLDDLLPFVVGQLNALSPEEQREALIEARQSMMKYLSPETKKLLQEHPDLVDKGWDFLLDKLADHGYEFPD